MSQAMSLEVLGAVDFDYQKGVVAKEVRDVGANGLLPSELVATYLPIPDPQPQALFGIGRLFAECPWT
jgi:hypothetical protein